MEGLYYTLFQCTADLDTLAHGRFQPAADFDMYSVITGGGGHDRLGAEIDVHHL